MNPMMSEPKKIAALIVAGKDGGEKSVPVEKDNSMGKEAAAKDILSAIESKDASKLVAAFENMMELCKEYEGSEDDESEMPMVEKE